MAGLELHPHSLITAVQMASISVRFLVLAHRALADHQHLPQASYIIEQFGLPNMSTDLSGIERWNDSSPLDRLKEMREAAATAAMREGA